MAIGTDNDPNARSGLAVAGLVASFVPSVSKQALDRGRVLAARPNAVANGAQKQWLFQLATGKPMSTIVPLTGGTIKLGKLTIPNGWVRATQASSGLGLLTLSSGLIAGVPNLADGIAKDDGSGIMTNRSGRTGVFGLAGSAMGVGVMGAALISSLRTGGGNTMARMLGHSIHTKPAVVVTGLAVTSPMLANELGAFDWLNRR